MRLGSQTICHIHANSQNVKKLACFVIPPNLNISKLRFQGRVPTLIQVYSFFLKSTRYRCSVIGQVQGLNPPAEYDGPQRKSERKIWRTLDAQRLLRFLSAAKIKCKLDLPDSSLRVHCTVVQFYRGVVRDTHS